MSSAERRRLDCVCANGLRACLVIGLLACAVTFTSARLYSSFAPYDDEGYIQLSLEMYRTHGGLYDKVISQYGPAYYLLSDWLHAVTRWPVTHDVARLKTLLCWLAACGLASWIVLRLTGARTVAGLAAIGVLFHLDRFGWEPGHPQEFAVLLILGTLWVATRIDAAASGTRVRWMILLGLLTGTLALTKLNLGGLLGIAVVAGLLLGQSSRWSADWLWRLVALFGMLLPLVLVKSRVGSWPGIALPAAVITGWVGLWARRSDGSDVETTGNWKPLAVFIAAAAASAAMWSAGVLGTGTSWGGLWHGLVGQHGRFLSLFYHDAPLPELSLGFSGLGLYFALTRRPEHQLLSVARWVAMAALLFVGLRVCGETWQPIRHGLADRSAAGFLAALVPPFAWLLLIRPSHTSDSQIAPNDANLFARRLLAVLAVTQPLGAIPTPGTQLAVGTLPALLLLFLLVGDLAAERTTCPVAYSARLRWCLYGLSLLTIITLSCRAIEGVRVWRFAEPLGLRGAEWLRLPPEQANQYRRTVACLRSQSDQFVASPTGLCSLYLWSGMLPPTTYNVTYWEALLSTEQQAEVIAALSTAERPRLVVNRQQGSVVLKDAPLNRYLESRFTQLEQDGPLQVWAPAVMPVATSSREHGPYKQVLSHPR